MGRRTLAALIGTVVLAAACAGGGSGGGTTPPTSPSPSGSPLSVPAMQLLVLRAVGHLDYCDPDQYPVGHGTPLSNAEARLPQIRADAEAYAAILAFEGIDPHATLTDDQKIAVNEDYKQIQAFDLQPDGTAFSFRVYTRAQDSPTNNESRVGTVDRSGHVHLDAPGPGTALMCPICLAIGTMIATPDGPVPVQDLRIGMAVWTTDRHGRRVAAVVVQTGHMLAPIGHEVVHLVLADGRSVLVSPGHPTPDGRPVGDLRPGDRFDGSVVRTVTLVPYADSATFDLLPSGPAGTYFASGILLGSTLAGANHPGVILGPFASPARTDL